MARIVVVDDSALVRRKVGAILEEVGHVVAAVASGEEAVERTLREPFDLVVSDVRMGAMTGVQLCRVLRGDPITRDVPIVLLSASDDARSRFWGRHAGADAYLAKDDAMTRLVPTVERLLESRPVPKSEPPRRPSHVDAAARVAAVLDRQLFDAVIASEVRALLGLADDRRRFLAGAAELLADVLVAPFATITLVGHDVSHAIVARRPIDDDELLTSSLGLESTPEAAVVLRDIEEVTGPSDPGVVEIFEVRSGDSLLGLLRLFGGGAKIGSDDRSTAQLLAETLVPVLRTLFLVEETRRLAHVDPLTGVANRRTLVERLELEDRRARRYGGELSVILLDVDHFKSVNDRYGHTMGDVVLHAVASAMRDAVRNVDLAGRWGGEEFLVVLPECDSSGAQIVGERIRQAIAGLGPFEDGPEKVTASLGVSTRTRETPSAFVLVEAADEALYRAKDLGRDRMIAASSAVSRAPSI